MRKLKFIRQKNLINSGKVNAHSHVKVAAGIGKQELIRVTHLHLKENWNRIKRKWKLKFHYSHFEIRIGIENNDFPLLNQ